MTPSQLPVGLRIQQTIAAFYRAGYPIEEIADAIGLAPSTCEVLVDAMRRVGWTLRRPRGAHEHIQIDNALLRERYLQRRAEARRRRERLSLSELARVAGLAKPGREPDPTWIGRLLRPHPCPTAACARTSRSALRSRSGAPSASTHARSRRARSAPSRRGSTRRGTACP
jgi:DNA-binding MarR family transcriptional regulator